MAKLKLSLPISEEVGFCVLRRPQLQASAPVRIRAFARIRSMLPVDWPSGRREGSCPKVTPTPLLSGCHWPAPCSQSAWSCTAGGAVTCPRLGSSSPFSPSTALYCLASTLGAAATSSETKVTWFKVSQASLLPVLTAGTCFVLEYVFPGRWLTRHNLALLALPPLLLALLIFAGNGRFVWETLAVGPGGYIIRSRGQSAASLRSTRWAEPTQHGGLTLAVRPLTVASLARGLDAGRADRGPHPGFR